MKSERDNAVNVKACCALLTILPYFTALSRRVESWPALKQYLFPVTIAKSGANACTKCPIVTILYSIPTGFYSSRTWLEIVQPIFRNGSYRRFRHQVHCRRVRSFLAVLFHCSLRRNSSRYTLDQLAAI